MRLKLKDIKLWLMNMKESPILKNKKNIYWTQTVALMKKSLVVFFRHYKTAALVLLSPGLICLILVILQFALKYWSVSSFIEKNPETEYLGKIQRCITPADCITIMGIVLDRTENEENLVEVEKILRYVSEKNDLIYDKDIKISKSIKSYTNFSNFLDENKNKTYFGVVFCYDVLDADFYGMQVNIPCKPQFVKKDENYKFYTIVYNISNGPNDFLTMPYIPRQKDPLLMKLKLDLDNAYLELMHNQTRDKGDNSPPPKIAMEYCSFPRTEDRFFADTSIVNNFGCPFFLLISLLLYILTLIDFVKEKQYKLRKSLLIIGLKNSAFWSSWFILSFFYSLIIVLILLSLVYILQWELFINTPFPIMFVLFFLITFDLQLTAFLMGTLIENVKTAYSSAFCYIIVAIVIEAIFTIPYIFEIIYSNNVNFPTQIFKGFLYLFCPYSFSKAYIEIAEISSTKLNEFTLMNMVGRKYEYSDLFTVNENTMIILKIPFKIPPTYQSFIWLIVDGIIYIFLIII